MIPYVREIKFDYGACDQVSPLIRRVVANNPGPFTYLGTGTYIIGKGEVAVIDPGPDMPEHLDALMAADHAPVQGFVLLVAIVFSLVNLGVDMLGQWADPRSEMK